MDFLELIAWAAVFVFASVGLVITAGWLAMTIADWREAATNRIAAEDNARMDISTIRERVSYLYYQERGREKGREDVKADGKESKE